MHARRQMAFVHMALVCTIRDDRQNVDHTRQPWAKSTKILLAHIPNMSVPLEISLDNKDRSLTLCFSKVNWKNRRYSSPPFGMPSPLSTRILKFWPFTAWYRRQSIPHVLVWLGDRFRDWFLIENDYNMFSRWPKHLIFPSVCQLAIWFMRPYPKIRSTQHLNMPEIGSLIGNASRDSDIADA